MTLCMAWRDSDNGVHFASDSRLTLATRSHADVAIKVLSVPFKILEPGDGNPNTPRTVRWQGELGLCFAGSAANSFAIKETVVEIIKSVQYAPGYTDISLAAFARYLFSVYRIVSKEVCQTALGSYGRAEFLIGGVCPETHRVRVFQFSTDQYNEASLTEVLTSVDQSVLIGSGANPAHALLPVRPTTHDFLRALKAVIDDPKVDSVGGHIQYGAFNRVDFKVFAIAELGKNAVHYWRGAIDLNSDEFMKDGTFIPSIAHINPFRTFEQKVDESLTSENSDVSSSN